MNNTSRALALAVGMALAGSADAAWVGSAEFGFSNTTGNTQTTIINSKADLNRTIDRKHHKHNSEAKKTENETHKSAKRYLAGYKPSYFFTEKNYVFGMLRYDRDNFALICSRFNEIVGYGRQVVNNDFHSLDAEIGGGARQSNYVPDPSTVGVKQDELLLFLGLKY